MKSSKKLLLSSLLAIFALSSNYSQSINTVVYSFRIVNDLGKSMTCKQFITTDYIRNDTVRYIKIIFQDQAKSYNNGYVILNSREKLQQFISDLELMKAKISTEEVMALTQPSYKLDINNPVNRQYFKQHLNLRVCIYEPNSTAFIGFKEDKLQVMIDDLRKVIW
jgi:hypothetical protein